MKCKKTTLLTVSLLFITILFSSPAFNPAIAAQINEMNFKNAEIEDVLKALAETVDKNLVVDSSVQGKITIHLSNVSFNKALYLVTTSTNLDYHFDDNTVIVATAERIEELFKTQTTKIIEIKNISTDKAGETLKNIFPELKIIVVADNNQIIIKGKSNIIESAIKLVKKIDIVQPKEEKKDIVKTVQVKEYNLTNINETITSFYPDLQVKTNQDKDEIILKGASEEIDQALKLINKLDTPEDKLAQAEVDTDDKSEAEPATNIYQIDYIELETIQNILTNNFSDLTISLNPESKQIIVNGNITTLNKAEDIIQDIDTPQKQVMIEARVEEISRSETEEVGFKEEEGNLARITFLREGDEFTGVELNWPDYLDMLNKKGKSETLAHPRLMTLNGKEGNLTIGDRIPVPMGSGEDATIQYIEAGISLEFIPWISSDNLIRLQVNPTVSSLGETRYGEYPTIKSREVSTTLDLKDGETFAIGGLIQESNRIDRSKVPFISNFPLIGRLFTKNSDEKRKTELMIFITPHIIKPGQGTTSIEPAQSSEKADSLYELENKHIKNLLKDKP